MSHSPSLEQLISQSSLTKDQKELWGKLLGIVSDEGRKFLEETVAGQQERLMLLIDILSVKIDFLRSGNATQMDRILKLENQL